MRYQERIYIQNDNGAVRNRDILNVNMSSDISVFENPLFNLSGASKIDCSGNTGTTYVITTATTIPLTFEFTANTNSFTANSATFKYEIYKYNTEAEMFFIPPMYKSESFVYSGFSEANAITQTIPLSGLSLDGEYLVKGYFEYDVSSEFMNKLGKTVDTLLYRSGSEYGLYNSNEDFFFRAIKAAETPIFQATADNVTPPKGLNQLIIFPESGITNIVIPTTVTGSVLLTLNGLILAQNYDYVINGSIITLSGETVSDDIITIISGTDGSANNLQGDTIFISVPIVSGSTNGEGTNRAYFNTTSGKFEIYTNVTPIEANTMIVMINGATLANGIDYYQSTTNPKRFILEGDLLLDDIITLAYYAKTNVVNGIITNKPLISWKLNTAPELNNGYFSLEVSSGKTFNDFYYSGNTPYVSGQIAYNDTFIATGTVGTTLYYRVKNSKDYVTMCGDIINDTVYSEIIPIVIQTNSINSY